MFWLFVFSLGPIRRLGGVVFPVWSSENTFFSLFFLSNIDFFSQRFLWKLSRAVATLHEHKMMHRCTTSANSRKGNKIFRILLNQPWSNTKATPNLNLRWINMCSTLIWNTANYKSTLDNKYCPNNPNNLRGNFPKRNHWYVFPVSFLSFFLLKILTLWS